MLKKINIIDKYSTCYMKISREKPKRLQEEKQEAAFHQYDNGEDIRLYLAIATSAAAIFMFPWKNTIERDR